MANQEKTMAKEVYEKTKISDVILIKKDGRSEYKFLLENGEKKEWVSTKGYDLLRTKFERNGEVLGAIKILGLFLEKEEHDGLLKESLSDRTLEVRIEIDLKEKIKRSAQIQLKEKLKEFIIIEEIEARQKIPGLVSFEFKIKNGNDLISYNATVTDAGEEHWSDRYYVKFFKGETKVSVTEVASSFGINCEELVSVKKKFNIEEFYKQSFARLLFETYEDSDKSKMRKTFGKF